MYACIGYSRWVGEEEEVHSSVGDPLARSAVLHDVTTSQVIVDAAQAVTVHTRQAERYPGYGGRLVLDITLPTRS